MIQVNPAALSLPCKPYFICMQMRKVLLNQKLTSSWLG